MTMTLDGTNGVTFNDTSLQGAAASPFGLKNRLINGDFGVAQRGTSFTSTGSANNDDTYVLDRWYILSDGNDVIDVTQTTTVPTNAAKNSIGLDVETVNKKFGIAQIIENVNCIGAIGNSVTLSFQAKVSSITKLDNVKCAIVAWSGTADTVTSDIISAWGVEGTNPTLIANATYENTPANLNVTTSFATYSVTATVDTASTSNILVFIWSDVTDTTLGDFLYITNAQLEIGTTATPFERRLYNQELANCQRYYWQLPAANTYGAGMPMISTGQAWSGSSSANYTATFPVTMRTTPTLFQSGLELYSPNIGPFAATISLNSNSKSYGAVLATSGSTGLTAGSMYNIVGTSNATDFIGFGAEL